MIDDLADEVAAVRAALEENASNGGLVGARIHVARRPHGGLRVRVVHDGLAGLADEERRAMLLVGVESKIEDADLITSAEEEWYGVVFSEPEERLPVWPEALEPTPSSSLLTFASDLDQDVPAPAIVTFYSLRGGVGRTTALAATARILAGRARRVLCIDMDFEAPGLPYLFGLPEPGGEQGAVPLLLALERGEEVDIRDHVQRVSEAEELYCLPAGKLGAEYAQRLRLLDPESWYREAPNPLHRLLDLAAKSSIAPDVILLDARTGISPISAPLLFDVSDLAVICFFPHPQAARGTELLVQALLASRTRRSSGDRPISPEPRFLVSPVPPGPSAERVRSRALSWIDHWLGRVHDRRGSEVDQLQGEELTHFISYSAEMAYRDQIASGPALDEDYAGIADWLEQVLPQPEAVTIVKPTSKRQVLDELDFSTGTAEYQESFFEDFVRTRVSVQAMEARYPLVIGRKGTGKTAIFRWLLERSPEDQTPIPVVCPNAYRDRVLWALGAEGFAAIERRGEEGWSGWQSFWSCYVALAAFLALPDECRSLPPDRLGLDLEPLRANPRAVDELTVVDILSSMLTVPDAGLLTTRWLREMDDRAASQRFLLFDGLDTGFGNDISSRQRRMRAVTGLFTYLTESEPRFANLKFKVLLRFDIWQQLRFENKSHLFGRSKQLEWRDQAEYFKTALKQAARSASYRAMLDQAILTMDVDLWSQSEVFRAWNILVGERMKGGKTTFTRNWVWNRLADGLGDHGPRSLSQLFNEAVVWEKREEARSAYDRSIIRPRALVPSLESVSSEAIQALAEEFLELRELIDVLEFVGRTPLGPADIENANSQAADQIDLALEVGLLAIHEGGRPDESPRYRVPDLYRHALRMTRRGQA